MLSFLLTLGKTEVNLGAAGSRLSYQIFTLSSGFIYILSSGFTSNA